MDGGKCQPWMAESDASHRVPSESTSTRPEHDIGIETKIEVPKTNVENSEPVKGLKIVKGQWQGNTEVLETLLSQQMQKFDIVPEEDRLDFFRFAMEEELIYWSGALHPPARDVVLNTIAARWKTRYGIAVNVEYDYARHLLQCIYGVSPYRMRDSNTHIAALGRIVAILRPSGLTLRNYLEWTLDTGIKTFDNIFSFDTGTMFANRKI
jgi:hypothetical protein